MSDLNEFFVKVSSRHPKHHMSYDKQTHKYNSTYVSPSKWTLEISNRFNDLITKKQLQASLIHPQPGKPNYENMVEKKNNLINEINQMKNLLKNKNIRFKVQLVNSNFSKLTDPNKYTIDVNIPVTGRYKITSYVYPKSNNKAVPFNENDPNVSTVSKEIRVVDILIASIGDSYASGEGNPDKNLTITPAIKQYAEQNARHTLKAMKDDFRVIKNDIPNVTPELELAEWQEPLAHRSYKSGHSIAAQRIEGVINEVHWAATFLSFARSGAKIEEGLLKPNIYKYSNQRKLRFVPTLVPSSGYLIYRKKIEETSQKGSLDFELQIGQIDEMTSTARNRKIDFLIMTIGGNDIKWSSNFPLLIGKDIEFFDFIPFVPSSSTDEEGRVEIYDKTMGFIAQLSNKFKKLHEKIKLLSPKPRHILLTLYPNGFFGALNSAGEKIVTSGCGIFDAQFLGADVANIDKKDAELIRDLSIRLNTEIKTAARKYNWILVDGIDTDFESHGYCTETSYLVGAEKSFKSQGDWYGLLHPNEAGHNQYGVRIAEKIKKILQEHTDDFIPKLEPPVYVDPGIG